MNIDEQLRHERKFVVMNVGAPELRTLLRCHPAVFSEVYLPRSINNVYFELPDFRSYDDSVEGARDRIKIRIRWYGSTFGEAVKPCLECKIKHNALGFKRRFDLANLTVPGDLKGHRLRKALRRSTLPPDVTAQLATAKAVLLNTYRRAYFVSADHRFRITIDTNLRTYDVCGNFRQSIRRHSDANSVIVELKYDQSAEEDADQITNALPFRLSKSSKYVTGMDKLFLW